MRRPFKGGRDVIDIAYVGGVAISTVYRAFRRQSARLRKLEQIRRACAKLGIRDPGSHMASEVPRRSPWHNNGGGTSWEF